MYVCMYVYNLCQSHQDTMMVYSNKSSHPIKEIIRCETSSQYIMYVCVCVCVV